MAKVRTEKQIKREIRNLELEKKDPTMGLLAGLLGFGYIYSGGTSKLPISIVMWFTCLLAGAGLIWVLINAAQTPDAVKKSNMEIDDKIEELEEELEKIPE